LTKLQAKDLRRLVGLVNKTELQKEIDLFEKERNEIIKNAFKERQDLNAEATDAEIQNIKDSYEKQIKEIETAEYNKNIGVERAREEALRKEKENKDKQFTTEVQYLNNITEINLAYDNIIKQNKIKSNDELIKINTEYFNTLSNNFNEKVSLLTELDRANDIKLATEKIKNSDKLNIEIEKINKKYDKRAKEDQSNILKSKINQLEEANKTELDLIKQQENEKEIIRLKTELAKNETLTRNNLTFFESLFGTDDKAKEKAKATIDLAKEVFNVTTNLIKQQAQLETKQYDDAIALQQKRVTEAQKIADAGNSEYLQQEEDRLSVLEAKREASARRQLEIDSAIQASQILVAIAGATAQIAKPGASTVDIITAVTSIVGALGAGAQLVSQYQSNRPSFFEGTENVAQSLGTPQRQGRDGYDISVDGSERIVSGKINALLHDVPNSQLPTLVNAGMFALNFKPKENNVDLENKFNKLATQQALTNEYLKNLSINMNIDENGFGASLTTYLNNQKKIENA
jgi:hypothetical protein